MNINVQCFHHIFSHLFSLVLSINLFVAVLHTLVRNRTVGPAEPEAKRLTSSAPVCHHIANKPTFAKTQVFPFFGFLHINLSLYTLSPCMSLCIDWTHCWLKGKFLFCVCLCVCMLCFLIYVYLYIQKYRWLEWSEETKHARDSASCWRLDLTRQQYHSLNIKASV